MRELVERAVDLWTFGVPVVIIIGSLLRLLERAPARVRYVLVIAGFPVLLLLPIMPVAEPLTTAAGGAAPAADLVVPLVWAAGAALLLLREGYGHLRLQRERPGRQADAELRTLLEWPEGVALTIGSTTPMTIGLLRPRVILPERLFFPIATLRRIARHELSHARWRDPLVYAVLRVTAVLFWMSPLWLLLRWVRREREAAADEFALRTGSADERSYVQALLVLSSQEQRLASAMAGSDLAYRARRILAPPARRFPLAATLMLVSGVALAAVAPPLKLAVLPNGFVPPRQSISAPQATASLPNRASTLRQGRDPHPSAARRAAAYAQRRKQVLAARKPSRATPAAQETGLLTLIPMRWRAQEQALPVEASSTSSAHSLVEDEPPDRPTSQALRALIDIDPRLSADGQQVGERVVVDRVSPDRHVHVVVDRHVHRNR